LHKQARHSKAALLAARGLSRGLARVSFNEYEIPRFECCPASACTPASASCKSGLRHGSRVSATRTMTSEIERDERNSAADAATKKVTGFAGLLQSARNSINRNMEPFSEGLHKVVGGSTDSGYESDSEASVTEVRLARSAERLHRSLVETGKYRSEKPRPSSMCCCSLQEQMESLLASVSQYSGAS